MVIDDARNNNKINQAIAVENTHMKAYLSLSKQQRRIVGKLNELTAKAKASYIPVFLGTVNN